MATIFSKIVQGEIPAHKIAETTDFLAFLDVSPLVMGHVLVIPKQEIDYIFDVDDDLLGRMMVFAKQVAIAIKKTVPCKRIGVAVIGLEVPHCHIHLVPMQTMSDINFMQPKLQPSQEDLATMRNAIVKNL
ncbi:MAG TPA: HIT family protein [Bacteroidales bacterium]|nr:MAG: HIT-like protein [Bacteroidetes bacterium ADurb.Bin217]HPM13521.1 HIT family protein [Bacteroidales bacterium]